MYSYALFETAFGRCAVAWSERGIVALALPDKSEAQQRKKLRLRAKDATLAPPPPHVERAIEDVHALLRGDAVDLSTHALDLDGLRAKKVYEAVRAIPLGSTSTLGALGTTRAVLAANPLSILVPTHRVLANDGRVPTDVPAVMRILSIEAAHHSEGDGTFGFDVEAALRHLRRDAKLKKLIDRVPFRMKLRGTPSVFVALVEAIVYQQLSGRAAGTIMARVRALFPNGHIGPTPEQIVRAKDAALLGAGLSHNKLLAVRDLARRALAGEIPTMKEAGKLDDETLIARLTEVRGIGRWTVEMLLMFRLGRPDLLPVDDLGVRKGYMIAYGLPEMPSIAALEKAGEKWRPYRTIASWYMWRATELPRG